MNVLSIGTDVLTNIFAPSESRLVLPAAPIQPARSGFGSFGVPSKKCPRISAADRA
jgi:hypothetical protein